MQAQNDNMNMLRHLCIFEIYIYIFGFLFPRSCEANPDAKRLSRDVHFNLSVF